MLVDEMYLKKTAQFCRGNFIGCDEDGEFYKGIIVFMIQGLKRSVPLVVKGVPVTALNGEWLAGEMASCVSTLSSTGFRVRAIVTDNHAANVHAFATLHRLFPGNDGLSMKHPDSWTKTNLFFDNVHLVKNVRNNLMNAKKFVFPEFSFMVQHVSIHSDPGYVSWLDLKSIYEEDSKLEGNLRKAPKLTFKSLHPFNNKQNVSLALAIFCDTTIAASKSYCSDRKDMHGFLTLINTWWTIVNGKTRFAPNALANAITQNDGKTDFLLSLANWLSTWCETRSKFCLSKQTFDALIKTLRGQACLATDLFEEGFQYVIPVKFQSDPLENRFSQYRQMSGGNFLVSLREVMDSENILRCKSLLKANINFWEGNVPKILCAAESEDFIDAFNSLPHAPNNETMRLDDGSEEVEVTVSAYVAKKLIKRFKCDLCKLLMTDFTINCVSPYFHLISRGNLTAPSNTLADFVCTAFAVLDYYDHFIMQQKHVPARDAASYILLNCLSSHCFSCEEHVDVARKFAVRMIANIFYNNKQKISNDSVVKDALTGFKKRQRSK